MLGYPRYLCPGRRMENEETPLATMHPTGFLFISAFRANTNKSPSLLPLLLKIAFVLLPPFNS